MKKIVLSTLLLSSILYGSNNVSELEQAIKDSDFNTLKTLLTKRSIDKNECEKMADLSQQITSQRNKALISRSWAKAVTLSTLAHLACSATLIYRAKMEDSHSGFLLSINEFSWTTLKVSILALTLTKVKEGAEALYKSYNARKIRNLLQQTSNENNEIVA